MIRWLFSCLKYNKEGYSMNLERKVIAYMEQHHIIKSKGKIVLGLSGGADSVCLFHILNVCREQYQMAFLAVHVNHGIRGRQAEDDQSFVEELCAAYKVPLRVVETDVPSIARKEKKSLEETGRMVRYEAFREVQKEIGADYIAVAHHKNDQAETVLHNLCRGSGIVGLSGMKAEREGIVRPLLCVERQEIEGYLKTKGQPYQIDSTNKDNCYTRNMWRNEIIPLMKEGINTQTISHIADTAAMLGEVADFVEESGRNAWERMIETKEEKLILDLDKWKQEHVVIQKWMMQHMLYHMSGRQKDIGQIHVLDMIELAEKQVGKSLDLPYRLQAKRVYRGILLEKKETAKSQVDESKLSEFQEKKLSDIPEQKTVWEINLSEEPLLQSEIVCFSTYQAERLECEKQKMELETEPKKEENRKIIRIKSRKIQDFDVDWESLSKKTKKNSCTKCFDYDKIKGSVLFRRVEQEDFLQIDEAGHHKKIKKLFKDEKVDAGEREGIWLLAQGNQVIWIPGIRVSEAYKIHKDTKRVLEVTIGQEE